MNSHQPPTSLSEATVFALPVCSQLVLEDVMVLLSGSPSGLPLHSLTVSLQYFLRYSHVPIQSDTAPLSKHTQYVPLCSFNASASERQSPAFCGVSVKVTQAAITSKPQLSMA